MTFRPPSKLVASLAALALTILCAWFLIRDESLQRSLDHLRDAQTLPLLFAFALTPLLHTWRAWRLQGLLPLAAAGHGSLWSVSARVLMWNFLLPFRLGELTFPWLLRQAAPVGIAEATGALIFTRLVDLATIVAIGAVAAWFTLADDVLPGPRTLLLALGAIALATPAVLVAGSTLLARIRRLENLARTAARAISPARHLRLLITSLGLWLTHATIGFLVLGAIVGPTTFATAALAAAAGNLAFALPINGILGLGPQQVAWVTVLDAAGIDWAKALGAALLAHLVVFAGAMICGCIATAGRLRQHS
ncbi:MAG: lysylphosphatidylglycerol synthase domain-containing protein [Geminicoccaceae bacterium]